ncbi:FUSC family protein [Rhizobium jaguaris]|uniref:FUSC family protein n=1 Tax=Rhizobium jaguaris TaxID=1312183 RepID=A0A387FM39_9HYPH|nr:FUSC family protein [Rhizobium jaguaris]AYG58537.1 FUSC family protein [Rhizobium jaguaris]
MLKEMVNSQWRQRFVAEVKGLFTPGPRIVDEFECIASVLLAIVFGHLADVQNISWAAFSGYMVMRGHISESLLRGVLRIIGTIAGALLALAVVPLVWTSPAASSAALALIGGATLYGALMSKRSYAWLFVGLTFAMILLDKLEHPDLVVEAFVSTRIGETGAGTLACVLISMVSTFTLRRRWPGPPRPPVPSFGWNPEVARHAGQVAIALAMLPFLRAAFQIPELTQGAVTIMALMLIPLSSIGKSGLVPVSRRIVLRVGGCVCGAALAAAFLFLAHISAQAAAPVLIVGTMLGVMLGRHIENGKSFIAYGGTQFTLAILVTLVPDSYVHAELAPGVARLTGILVGILLLVPVLAGWHLVVEMMGERPSDPSPRG